MTKTAFLLLTFCGENEFTASFIKYYNDHLHRDILFNHYIIFNKYNKINYYIINALIMK